MKRKICAFCIVLSLLLTLAGCGGTSVESVVRMIDDPGKYTEEEIGIAMDLAIAEFDSWELNADLLSISYNGKEIAEYEASWMKTYDTDDVMVLLSTFSTGRNSGSLNSNALYIDWNWIFVKEEGAWVMKDWGYA